jgi:glucose-1-phosphate cytidylyltransferase
VREHVGSDTFFVTYGDGVSNVDLQELLAYHRNQGKLATVTAVRPPARFGGVEFDENGSVVDFTEKPQIGEGWINGGFLVFEPGVFDYIRGDEDSLEVHLLETLAAEKQLAAYQHRGFWQCVDTVRDLRTLRGMWDKQQAPWKTW